MWGIVHKTIANNLAGLDQGDRCLILIPRGHLKSTLVTIGWVIQQLTIDPTLRILIASANLKNAQGFLEAIKNHIRFNPEFVSRFGNLMDENKWTKDRINIKGHLPGHKEATITVASMGTDMTSQHYDLILMDDIINREFAKTEDQRQKVISFYMDCLDLLEPTGRVVIIGTRWHFADIYSKLIERNNKAIKTGKDKVFKFVVDLPMMTNPKYERRQFELMMDDPQTTFLFPEKFNKAITKKLYNDKTSEPGGYLEFACQQMNHPVSDKNAAFRFEDIGFVSKEPITATLYQNIDPAGSDRLTTTQDDTAICTTGITPQINIYNIDCWAEKTTASGMFVAADNQHRKYADRVRKIGIEKNFNAMNAMYIKEHYPEMAKKLVDYKASNMSSKDARIMGLQPYVANGKFFFVEHDDGEEYCIGNKIVKLRPGQYKLLIQMIDFGNTEHDDAIDCQAATLEFIKKPVAVHSEDSQEYIPDDRDTGY